MTRTRLSLLLAAAAALLAGSVRAATDLELSPKTVRWENPPTHGDAAKITGLEARAFLFGSSVGAPFGSPYVIVDIRNLAEAERKLDVSSGEPYSSSLRRAVTIPPHGTVHLTFPLPVNAIERTSAHTTILETVEGVPCVWSLQASSYRPYDSDNGSAFALITPAFSREKLAHALGEPTAKPKSGKDGFEPYDLSAVKYSLPLTDLPADWRAYSTFDAVFMTPSEHAALPPEVKDALEGYKAQGGSLFVVLPTADGGLADGCSAIRKQIERLKQLRVKTNNVYIPYRYRSYYYGGNGDIRLSDLLEGIPLGDVEPVPVGLILTLLAVFCLVIIPTVVVKAVRRNRRLSLFATIPLTAAGVSVLIITSIFIAFGTTPTVRVQSVTRLDQATKTATTHGAFAVRSPLSADGRITVDGDAAFACLPKATGGRTTFTDRYRLETGWVPTLMPTYFRFDRYGRCSAKLAVTRGADGSVTVANLLGAPVTEATVRLDGKLYLFGRIAPGAKATAAASKKKPDSWPPFDYERIVSKDTAYGLFWTKLVKLANEADRLQDGMYVARLEGCPFLTPPFGDRKVKGTSEAIVIGDFSGEELK